MTTEGNKGQQKKLAADSVKSSQATPPEKTCFIIMPIADHPDYAPGHFDRVYEHIIAPACIKAGFKPDRADDVQQTHVIILNILKRLLYADIALCDLSSKNPNVFYELGIRHAFDKPVTLIKDEKTSRIFDTGMLSDYEYTSDLRIDNVQIAVSAIAKRLEMTYKQKDERENSLIQTLKIEPAGLPEPTTVSGDTTVILQSIEMLGRRIAALEPATTDRHRTTSRTRYITTLRFDAPNEDSVNSALLYMDAIFGIVDQHVTFQNNSAIIDIITKEPPRFSEDVISDLLTIDVQNFSWSPPSRI